MKSEKKQIVKVEWLDAMSRTDWDFTEEFLEWGKKRVIHETIGFLLDSNKDYEQFTGNKSRRVK